MKTEMIAVSSRGSGMDAALNQAEDTARKLGLSHRETLHLRLLVEEMMNMFHSIIGQLEGRFWIETNNGECRLVLQAKTLMDNEQRQQFLSAATSGKNEAHRGIMGKLRAFFEPMPITDAPAYLTKTTLPGDRDGELTWSLEAYRERLNRRKDASEGASEEWDELEKSLVSHIADNVEVSIRGYDVQLVILKKLNTAK